MSRAAVPAAHRPRSRLSAADRRASIVAAATQVFSEVGYQRGTMSEVARRVGVSEPVIFQNFGSKAALFAAVIDNAAGQLSTAMREQRRRTRRSANGLLSYCLPNTSAGCMPAAPSADSSLTSCPTPPSRK